MGVNLEGGGVVGAGSCRKRGPVTELQTLRDLSAGTWLYLAPSTHVLDNA